MKKTVKRPEMLIVREVRFLIADPPLHWSENHHHELFCEKCQKSLVVFFAARDLPDVTPDKAQWWVPTSISCACLLPEARILHEFPVEHRRPKRDPRQLEISQIMDPGA